MICQASVRGSGRHRLDGDEAQGVGVVADEILAFWRRGG